MTIRLLFIAAASRCVPACLRKANMVWRAGLSAGPVCYDADPRSLCGIYSDPCGLSEFFTDFVASRVPRFLRSSRASVSLSSRSNGMNQCVH